MVIPYGLVLLVAAWVLAARHASADRASSRSKWVVGGVALVSTLASPLWPLIATVTQLSVCVYVIFYRIVTDELAKSGGDGSVKLAKGERLSP